MSGFGTGPYGTSGYGIGDSGGGDSLTNPIASLLVQSDGKIAGSECVVSGVGVPIVDTSRNDSFQSLAVDSSKWNEIHTGIVTANMNRGLNIRLIKSTVSASYALVSQNIYTSADVSLQYEIMSSINVPKVTAPITFAGLQFFVNASTYFIVGRRCAPGYYPQQIFVSYVVDNIEIGRAVIPSTATIGTLRIIKHGGILMALHNDTILYSDTVGLSGTGLIKLISDLNNQPVSTHIKFTSYASDTGVLFGTAPMLFRSIELGDKIDGLVPQSNVIGSVDVVAFNHFGLVGQQANAFRYLLVPGVKLSVQEGVFATVQDDPQLRD